MPQSIAFFGALTPHKLWERDNSRVTVSIYAQKANLQDTQIYDELPNGFHTNYIYRLEPGEIISLSSIDGHDLTKPWWVIRQAVGAGVFNECMVYQEYLDSSIMVKLEEKGITSTQGLPFLVLALLVGSQ